MNGGLNSTMTIAVRVVGRQAVAELNRVSSAVAGVSATAANSPGIFDKVLNDRSLSAFQRRMAIAKRSLQEVQEIIQRGSKGGNFNWSTARLDGSINGVRARLKVLGAEIKAIPEKFERVMNGPLVRSMQRLNSMSRQLTYTITLPFVLLGKSAFDSQMAIQRSMAQVTKVYGEFTEKATPEGRKKLEDELGALATSFELLSTRFGVHQEEVIDIAAAWASAGSAGAALAENTQLTLQAMILGELDAAQATEGLIAIQAQWGLSTKRNTEGVSEMSQALAILNMTENTTGVRMEGLIEAFERASGVARTSGMTFFELAGMVAALVPAAGSAAQAGNGLKSIISSLADPTKEVKDLLAQMGIVADSPEWMGKTVTDKIITIAEEFENLSTAQQNVVAAELGGRWQVSRLNILLRDVTDELGYYQQAVDAATLSNSELKQSFDEELLAVLESNPKQWDIMTNAMRNMISKAIIPLLPALFSVVRALTQVATWFSELDESTKKWILGAMVVLAVLGPLGQIFTVVTSVVGPLIIVLKFLATNVIKALLVPALKAAMKALGGFIVALGKATVAALMAAGRIAAGFMAAFWPIVAIVAAVGAAIALVMYTDIEEPIMKAVKAVGRWMMQLPRVFVMALNGVIRVLNRAVEVIVDGLSYLNPFARHSPSLVDNVRAGVGVILDEYKRFEQIPAMIRGAIDALDTFSQVAAPGMKSARQAELSDIRTKIAKNDPQAAQAAGGVIDNILALEAQLPGLAQEIDHQSRVVANWTIELKKADAALDAAQDRLDAAELAFASISDQLDKAKDRIAELGDMPIKGMRDLEDQIFANSMAQNKLNMELLEYEKLGVSLDSVRDKYAKLNGEIELLQSERSSLRLGGAGSDILSMWDDQIDALQQQKVGLKENETAIQRIERQLEELDLEGRFLELTKAINFDPLERQIDQMIDGLEEMTFDDIIAGIKEQQALVAVLQPQYDDLAATVEREKGAVEAAKTARDAITASLDEEQAKLDGLEDAYSSISALIRDMEQSMSGYADAAERARKAAEGEDMSAFEAAADADYAIDGGDTKIGREGGYEDIEEFNKKLQEEITKALEEIGGIDIFASIREGWNRLVAWIKEHKYELAGALAIAVGFAFGVLPGVIIAAILGLVWVFIKYGDVIWEWVNEYIVGPTLRGFARLGETIVNAWNGVTETLRRVFAKIGGVIMGVWNTYIWPTIQTIINTFKGPLTTAFNTAFGIISGIVEGFVNLWTVHWTVIWTVIEGFWGFFSMIAGNIWDIITESIIPIVVTLAEMWSNYFMKVIVPVIEVAWSIIKIAFESLWEIISTWIMPVITMLAALIEINFTLIWRVIKFAWENVIKPVLGAMWLFITDVLAPIVTWLWKEVVGPAFDGITAAIDWAWSHGIEPAFNLIKWGIENILAPAFEWVLDKIIRPIFSGIIKVVGWSWDKIATLIEGGVNFLGDAFNLIAGVINKIADFLHIDVDIAEVGDVKLPRLEWNIDIPENLGGKGGGGGGLKYMASGGVVPDEGGVFAGARAIIGEGSKVWPEFVIPTDPRYRPRAHNLLGDLARRIGGSMVPMYAKGGIVDQMQMHEDRPKRDEIGGWGPLGWAYNQGKDLVGSLVGWIGDKALEAMWKPVRALAMVAIDKIPLDFIKNVGTGLVGSIDDWIRGGDDASAKKIAASPIPKKGAGSWKVIPQLLDRLQIPYRILSTNRPGAIGRFSGQPSWHAQDRAIDLAGPTWLNHPEMLAIANAIYGAYKPYLHELIYGGPGAKNVYGGRDHQYQKKYLDEHINHVHASLARGGFVVPRVHGGGLFRIGEGLYDEKVQVLPLHGNDDEGGNTYNFYGDLSFPEIRNGNDAEAFISNLEALARPR